MTGYTVHTGTTVKFAGGWDRVFSGKKSAKSAQTAVKKSAKKTPAKAEKPAGKKPAKKARRSK